MSSTTRIQIFDQDLNLLSRRGVIRARREETGSIRDPRQPRRPGMNDMTECRESK